jgi:hypothetical protein
MLATEAPSHLVPLRLLHLTGTGLEIQAAYGGGCIARGDRTHKMSSMWRNIMGDVS